jgi:hypothetical protein
MARRLSRTERELAELKRDALEHEPASETDRDYEPVG